MNRCHAGVRSLEIEGRFVAFTAIGVYLEDAAVQSLASKWKGKSADELDGAVEFFRDIFGGQTTLYIYIYISQKEADRTGIRVVILVKHMRY